MASKVEKGFSIALGDLKPDRAFLVYPGISRYPKGEKVEAIGVEAMARELAAL